MNPNISLEQCLSFINCHVGQPTPRAPRAGSLRAMRFRSVTISRQSGSGAHLVAEKLREYLEHSAPNKSCPWTIFDRNLVGRVLEDHNLPKRLARFMPEDRVLDISDSIDELFGLHPSSWTLVRQTAETIIKLAELGNVILIGRGANVVTAKVEGVFHVRLIASEAKRVTYLSKLQNVSETAARGLLRREDRGRERYVKKHYDADVNDPLLYHAVLNTDLLGYDTTAQLIGHAMIEGEGPREAGTVRG